MTRRVARAAAIGLVLAVASLAATWGLLFGRPLPTTDGYYRMLGLDERAEVVRDVWGIPRVYASTDHDLWFLQGYVTAQDRLVQMEEMRAIARTEAATAESELAFAPVVLRDALDAYAAGVTKLVHQLREAQALPGELVLAGRSPADWTASDSLSLAGAYLGAPSSCLAAPASLSLKRRPVLAAALSFNGPAPGLYEIGLAVQGRRAVGVSIPGVPGLISGQNGWTAWAVRDAGRPASAASALTVMLDLLGATRLDDLLLSEIGVRRIEACAADARGTVSNARTVDVSAADLETMRLSLGPASGTGARIVADLADVDSSRSVVSSGASGMRASRHFDDQAPLWERGLLHPLPLSGPPLDRIEGDLVLRAR